MKTWLKNKLDLRGFFNNNSNYILVIEKYYTSKSCKNLNLEWHNKYMDTLTDAQLESIKDVFTVIDTNQNGSIDLMELGKGLRALGLNPTNSEVKELMGEYDTDNNSSLTFDEFSILFLKYLNRPDNTESRLIEHFNKLDANHDGKIDVGDLRKILLYGDEALTEDEIDRVIEAFDVNEDGKLSLDEFLDGILGRNRE